jgi:beta-glucosidase
VNTQQDAKEVTWLAPARLFSRNPSRNNLNAFANAKGALQFDMVVVKAPKSAVTLSMGCGEGCGGGIDLAATIAKWTPAEKHTVKVPLSCFVQRGTDLGGVEVPFSIEADAPFAASFTNIKVVAGAGADADVLDCAE